MTEASVAVGTADLAAAPGGPRVRQVLFGQRVTILATLGAFVRIRAARDGYEGWVAADALGTAVRPTHRVAVAATHLYPAPDIKAGVPLELSCGAEIAVADTETTRFVRTLDGRYAVAAHLAPIDAPASDPVAVAEGFLGTPYLWGGNGRAGIDCSGLVQAALLATGHACPGDSADQERALGTPLAEAAPLRRGDLIFWRGHVALVRDAGTMIHANAHHMAVTIEDVRAGIARIAATDGPVTSRRRL